MNRCHHFTLSDAGAGSTAPCAAAVARSVRLLVASAALASSLLAWEAAAEADVAPATADLGLQQTSETEELRVVGTSRRGIALDSRQVDFSDPPMRIDNVLQGLTHIPGLDANGQGGDFQVFSIRGVSRQRVLTRIGDVPIVSDRRAGASVSFVDPLLLQGAEVIRGPASTLYGSLALGGSVQIEPARYDGVAGRLDYASQGDRNAQHLAWGNESWSLGIARRQSFDDETPDGDRRFSRFERLSMLLSTHHELRGLEFELLVLPALGWDVGKPNEDFPDRTTLYSRERHWVVSGSVASPDRWRVAFYAHPNELQTDVREADQLNEVTNEAIDFGLSMEGEHHFAGGIEGELGFDYMARRDVNASELEWMLDAGGLPVGDPSRQETLSGGEEDELGLRLVGRWQRGVVGLEAGLRGSWVRQTSTGNDVRSDGSVNAFAGARVALPAGFEFSTNFSTGLRNPSLAERFFSGTTGRGLVIGNPDLESERAIDIDATLGWWRAGKRISLGFFRNDIDRYIERIDVAEDVRSFRNVTAGVIWGVEGEGAVPLPAEFEFFGEGHWMQGRTDAGMALSDIPPARLGLGLRRSLGRAQGELRYRHRFAKSDPGSGERAIASADLLDVGLRWRAWQDLWLGFAIRNLTGESYFATADDRAVPEAGRSFGLSLSWVADSNSSDRRGLREGEAGGG